MLLRECNYGGFNDDATRLIAFILARGYLRNEEDNGAGEWTWSGGDGGGGKMDRARRWYSSMRWWVAVNFSAFRAFIADYPFPMIKTPAATGDAVEHPQKPSFQLAETRRQTEKARERERGRTVSL